MNIRTATIEEYLEQIDPGMLETTCRIVNLMREQLNGAEERVAWGIALFHHKGREIAGIAPRNGFFSLYLSHESLLRRYRERLGDVSAGKGCIRFRRFEDLNIEELASLLAEAREHS